MCRSIRTLYACNEMSAMTSIYDFSGTCPAIILGIMASRYGLLQIFFLSNRPRQNKDCIKLHIMQLSVYIPYET